MAIYEMRALAGLEWKDENVTTVGGYVVRRLVHLPRVGEQLRINGYIVTVEQAGDRRSSNLASAVLQSKWPEPCAMMRNGKSWR